MIRRRKVLAQQVHNLLNLSPLRIEKFSQLKRIRNNEKARERESASL